MFAIFRKSIHSGTHKIDSGKESFRYNKSTLKCTDYTIKKALVGVAIKEALLEINRSVLNEVTERLEHDHGLYVFDCYDKPKILAGVLKDLFGKAHLNILCSINEKLKEFSDQEPMERFLATLNSS